MAFKGFFSLSVIPDISFLEAEVPGKIISDNNPSGKE
jgi:hypothetical protein